MGCRLLSELDKEILRAKADAEKAFIKAIDAVNSIDDKIQDLEKFLSATQMLLAQEREACKHLAREIRLSLNLIQSTNGDCD